MKKLQVGDECYIRWLGEIYKCTITKTVMGLTGKKLYAERNGKFEYYDLSHEKVRIVYPFPCIKVMAK